MNNTSLCVTETPQEGKKKKKKKETDNPKIIWRMAKTLYGAGEVKAFIFTVITLNTFPATRQLI